MESVLRWVSEHWNSVFSNVGYLAIAMIGAAISHIFFQLPNANVRPFLQKMLPEKGEATIEALQFLIVVIAGGFTAMFLLQPQGATAAFLGGFSWYATLNQIASRSRSSSKSGTLKAKKAGAKQ